LLSFVAAAGSTLTPGPSPYVGRGESVALGNSLSHRGERVGVRGENQ